MSSQQFSARARARRGGPATSQAAADQMNKSGRVAIATKAALNLVRQYPGRTARELRHLNTSGHDIWKRLSDLRRAGLVKNGPSRECKVSGLTAMTWWPASKTVV